MSKVVRWSGCNCVVRRGKFDIDRIPDDCAATWRLIGSGCTVGIFQLEKPLGQDWARKAKPESIDELAALLSILRPGPLESGMSQDYCDVRLKKKSPTYLHPALKPILSRTYGALIYQEQSLDIAKAIAGFSLIEADTLRKGLGKKDPETIAKLGKVFVEKAVKAGLVTREQAQEIFSWIEKGQRYLFNKSHAVGYATTAYETAWLKCHFPHEFYTSYLTFSGFKGDAKDEVYKLAQDARLFGIDVLPPDVRRGNPHFEMSDEGICFGLSNIRGVGLAAIEKITKVIAEHGPLLAWSDFLRGANEIPRNVAEALVKAGACECYKMSRNYMLAELEAIYGTTTRDEQGEKIELRGLTEKELDYFLTRHNEHGGTVPTLLHMSESPVDTEIQPISKLKKDGVIEQIIAREGGTKEELQKIKRPDLNKKLKELGYDASSSKRGCSNEARRLICHEKAVQLQQQMDMTDTNTAKAEAEKHFLGISLSCSPADDADNSQATHTCVDVARAPNGPYLKVVAIIDLVRHTKTKRGKKPGSPMCFVTISDSTYSIDRAVVFPNAYEELKHLCKENTIVLVEGYKRDGSFLVEEMKKLL